MALRKPAVVAMLAAYWGLLIWDGFLATELAVVASPACCCTARTDIHQTCRGIHTYAWRGTQHCLVDDVAVPTAHSRAQCRALKEPYYVLATAMASHVIFMVYLFGVKLCVRGDDAPSADGVADWLFFLLSAYIPSPPTLHPVWVTLAHGLRLLSLVLSVAAAAALPWAHTVAVGGALALLVLRALWAYAGCGCPHWACTCERVEAAAPAPRYTPTAPPGTTVM